MSTRFPNKAGDHADTDDILRAELKAAGIPTFQEAEGKPPEYMADLLRAQSGEVKTSVRGVLCGWTFERSWYYWRANGPGIPVEVAERLNNQYALELRVAGMASGDDPRRCFYGLGVGSYHIDTQEALNALAQVLHEFKAANDAIQKARGVTDE